MKKVVILTFYSIFSYSMCSMFKFNLEKQYADSPPRELFSDGEEYSILAVGEDIDHSEEIMGLNQVRYFSSLEEVKNQYPDLKVEGSPFFIIFNDKEVVLRTSELNKAIRFVEENY
ncbi:hypothetical protein [Priestia megaterium]